MVFLLCYLALDSILGPINVQSQSANSLGFFVYKRTSHGLVAVFIRTSSHHDRVHYRNLKVIKKTESLALVCEIRLVKVSSLLRK